MSPKLRARSEQERQEKREAILQAAAELFDEMPFAAITMAEAARRVGLAKGTLYLYFATKEEMFLALLESDLDAWISEAEQVLDALKAPAVHEVSTAQAGARAIAQALIATLETRPALIRLMVILNAILEQNISLEKALAFKQALLAGLGRLGGHLERHLPFLVPGEGARLLLRLNAFLVGLYQMAAPGPVIQQVLAQPGYAALQINFAEELYETFLILVAGLQARKEHSNG